VFGFIIQLPSFGKTHMALLLPPPFMATVIYRSCSTLSPRGLIGPAREFGVGQLYNPLLWMILVGAVLPIPFWYLARAYPNRKWLQYINIPVLLTGVTWIPPATGINYSSWFLVGFVFRTCSALQFSCSDRALLTITALK
jgi:hypothetical protein